jgi:hypothetical protein
LSELFEVLRICLDVLDNLGYLIRYDLNIDQWSLVVVDAHDGQHVRERLWVLVVVKKPVDLLGIVKEVLQGLEENMVAELVELGTVECLFLEEPAHMLIDSFAQLDLHHLVGVDVR